MLVPFSFMKTAPVVPVATAATGVGDTSFTANWNAFSGASYYLLDVSLNSSFSSFVGSYQNYVVVSTSQVVSGLSSNTTYYYRVRAAINVDTDAAAFVSRVYTAGGALSYTEVTATEQLVADMKSYGIWTSMRAVYPMVGASAAACAQNLKSSSFTGTFTSGWTFASTGVTPNGTSAYMDTNLTPSSSLIQNSTHLSYYSRTNDPNKYQFEIGSYNVSASGVGSSSFGISYQSPANSFRLRISSATPTTTYTVTDTRGFFIGNRTNSTQQKIYNAGVLVNTFNANSDGLSTIQIALAANRISISSLGDYSSKQCAFASIGDGLTDTQASNFYTAVQAFQTTLSRNV